MRKSVKHKKDQTLFDFFKEELSLLHQQEEMGEIEVYYFDETGINLTPVVPYGWQKIGKTHRLSSLPSKNHTVVGFMSKSCRFYGFRFEGAATAATTVKCIEEFLKEIKKKTIVILDNASIHKAKMIREKIPEWKSKGLFLQYIPAYSPELNLIERLWEELKYRWLNKPSYFSSTEQLAQQIDDIVRNIGTKYMVNFA
jgi:transposase